MIPIVADDIAVDVLNLADTPVDICDGRALDAYSATTRDAVARMIDLLTARHGLKPVEAYMLCSVAGDLRISEIVDMPNWVVSFYFPRLVLE